MTPVERARFLRQANALAGCLTGLSLLLLNGYLPGFFFLAMGFSHPLAELRHTLYRLQDSFWMGLGLLLNVYAMAVVLKQVWMK